MSEHERGESRWLGPFLLGVLVGVLLTLGGSATFFMVVQERVATRAVMEAERARAEAKAEAERRQLEAFRAFVERDNAERARKADEARRKDQGK